MGAPNNGDVPPRDQRIPPVQLDDKAKKTLGLMEDGLAGIAKRREDLDITAAFTLPLEAKLEIGADAGKMADAQAKLQQQAQFSVGAAVLQALIENPQSRLIPVPYTVRSVRHDLDLRVAFWELNPVDGFDIEEIDGRWALGMKYLAIKLG